MDWPLLIRTKLLDQQYSRYAAYAAHLELLSREEVSSTYAPLDPATSAIEFGGSNGFLQTAFEHIGVRYEVSRNYPLVDLHDLREYRSNSYDYVILDEVLEHVTRPWLALKEVLRILKPGGCLLASAPFMIAEHKCPDDYWRFTRSGFAILLEDFSRFEVYSWGNFNAVQYILPDMMVSARQAIGDGAFDMSNNERVPITVWAYAWK